MARTLTTAPLTETIEYINKLELKENENMVYSRNVDISNIHISDSGQCPK
jgi:hypothetical protein